MKSSQRLERDIVERLHAKRHPVDAGGTIAAKPRRLDAGRVGLEGYFHVRRDTPVFSDRIQNRADGFWLHQRWCAAAKKDRGDFTARRARRGGFDFARKGAGESVLVDRGMADMAVEIAIRALRQAKRPVHVNPEGLLLSAGQGRSP